MSSVAQAHTVSTAHKVDSNVYIGGYLAAANPEFVKQAGVSRIIKMFADDPSYPGGFHRHPGVTYLVVNAEDVPEYRIAGPAYVALRFLQEGLQKGEKILVHCHAGISRSSTIVLLHMMVNHKLSLPSALSRLKMIRPQVQPNDGFMRFLKLADSKLHALREKMASRKISAPRREFKAKQYDRPRARLVAAAVAQPIETATGLQERELHTREGKKSTPMLSGRTRILPDDLTSVPWRGGGIHAGDRDLIQDEATTRSSEGPAGSSTWTFKG